MESITGDVWTRQDLILEELHTQGLKETYRIVSNKRPGGVAIFQKGDVYKRQVFNAKMQCLSLFTMKTP